MKKHVVFAISSMRGGGAERVLTMLANQFSELGYRVTLLITNQRSEACVGYDVFPEVKQVFLEDGIAHSKPALLENAKAFSIRAACKLTEKMHFKTPGALKLASFDVLYKHHRTALQNYLKKESIDYIIAFLQPTIQLLALHHADTTAKMIVSERLDPERLFKSRYGKFFVDHYYQYISHVVFQSETAQKQYPIEVQAKSSVIPNPLRSGLPEPYTGKRAKRIVNFCRLTRQKNLLLLLRAFEMFHCVHADYELVLFGEASSLEEIEVKQSLLTYAQEHGLSEYFHIKPFQKEIHSEIVHYSMFVSSSDYEGMSNAMLEAMAIGLPSICTDCPAGGARAIIRDHENGILVPVGNAEAMCRAMCEVAGDAVLAERLSMNGQKLREELSLAQIAERWEEHIK